jgi:hypothetical protein
MGKGWTTGWEERDEKSKQRERGGAKRGTVQPSHFLNRGDAYKPVNCQAYGSEAETVTSFFTRIQYFQFPLL